MTAIAKLVTDSARFRVTYSVVTRPFYWTEAVDTKYDVL